MVRVDRKEGSGRRQQVGGDEEGNNGKWRLGGGNWEGEMERGVTEW